MDQSMQIYERAEAAVRDKSLTSKFSSRRRDKSIKWSTERDYAIEIIRNGGKAFQGCDLGSLGTALLDLAATGLSLSPRLGLGYLVPYQGRIKLEISYKGMQHMCYRSGVLKQLNVGLVREGDHFVERHTGSGPDFEHIPVLPKKGQPEKEIVACWCMAEFMNGGRHYERMDVNDFQNVIKAAMAKNKDKDGVPQLPFTYKLWLGEMLKKSTIRRAWKHWPKDEALREVVELVDRNSTPVEFDHDEAPYDEPEGGVICISEEQVAQLQQMVRDEYSDDDDEKSANRVANWMTGLAEKYSVSDVSGLPEPLFKQAVETIINRIEAVRKQKKK